MKNFRFYWALLPILFLTCRSNDKDLITDDSVKLYFDLDTKSVMDIHTSGLINDIEIIYLEDKSVLKNISKFISYKDNFYFLDSEKMTVDIFGSDGRFKKQIQDIGNEMDQYSQLIDISINKDENTLQLLSRKDRKLLEYNLEGTEKININRLPTTFFEIIRNKEGYIAYLGNNISNKNSKSIWLMDNNFNFKNGYFDINRNFESYYYDNISSFSRYSDNVFFIKDMDYNIYSFNKNRCEIQYSIDFGRYNWPSDIISREELDKLKFETRFSSVRNIEFFQETNNYIIISFTHRAQKFFGIMNKKTKETFLAQPNDYTDELLIPFGKIIGIDENYIYSAINTHIIKNIMNGTDGYNDFSSEYPFQVRNMKEKFGHLNLDSISNYFLVRYDLN